MKLSFYPFLLSLSSLILPTSVLSAVLDCNAQISRTGVVDLKLTICGHFAGVNPKGYHSWYVSNNISSKYPNLVYMPGADPVHPENGAAIHWRTDGEFVYLAVAARAKGWLGFGLAEAGGMIGADMALFTAAKPNEIVDAFTTDVRYPQIDECSQDWELLSSNVDKENGFLMFEVKRALDTGDEQDKVIVDDSSTLVPAHRVIAAWGDRPDVGHHGLNRARGAIRFFGHGNEVETFKAVMDRDSEGSFEVSSINHEIAANETEYVYTCVSRQDLIDQGVLDTQDMLNIIGFEPFVNENAVANVHHYIVTGSQQGSCDGDEGFEELVYVWAPGDHPMALPDTLGTPLFGGDGYQAFLIEVHYDNPKLEEGIIDSSGVRLYWTSEPRDEQIGIMVTGDPDVALYGQSIGEGITGHSFECPGSCSQLVGEPVTVLREYLHMHKTGLRITNEQIRTGKTIRTASVEYWEFDQNGNAAVQQDPFDVQPGDGFKTTCYFEGSGDEVFGLSSSEEMCMAFLYYHPRKQITAEAINEQLGFGLPSDFSLPWFCGYDTGIPLCETEYAKETLDDISDIERTFGIQNDGCGTGIESTTQETLEEGDTLGSFRDPAAEDGSFSITACLTLISAVVGTVTAIVL